MLHHRLEILDDLVLETFNSTPLKVHDDKLIGNKAFCGKQENPHKEFHILV